MVPIDAHNSAIPGAIPQKWEKTCLRCDQTAMQNFTPICKAPAEKSVTVHKYKNTHTKETVNLVSRPTYYVTCYVRWDNNNNKSTSSV